MSFTRMRPPRGRSAARGLTRRRACLAAGLTTLVLGTPAHAEALPSSAALSQLPLDTLLNLPVSGASRLPQRMSDTAASVTVIDAAEIRALGARTLAEVLAGVRGVSLTSDRGYSYAGVRGPMPAGDLNTRLLLLIDGNRVNDPVYDQAPLGDEFPLDITEIERIEFIPGQGAAVYGANAMNGVINVVTRSPRDGRDGARIGLQAGSGGHRQLAGTWQGRLGDGALRLSASRTLADGEPVRRGTQWSDAVDDVRRTALRARWDADGWSVSALHADRDKALPLFPGVVFGQPGTRYRDTHSLLNVERRLKFGDTELTSRAWLGRYRFTGTYVYDGDPAFTLNRDVAQAHWGGLELRALRHLSATHSVTLGTEWQRMPSLRQTNDDLSPLPARHLENRREGHRSALFAEDQWRFAPDWTLNAGARIDERDGDRARFSPRVGLVWRAAPRWVVKGIAGSAFRPPNAYEAHYAVPGPGGYQVDPTLRTETIRGQELAVEGWPSGQTRVAASLYENRMSDLIALTYDAAGDTYRYRNVGSVHTRGLDAEVETRWPAGTRLRLSTSWRLGSDNLAPEATQQFPRRMAKLAWIVPCPQQCQFGLEGLAMSRRESAPGQVVFNATLSSHSAVEGWQWSIALRNLTDRRLVDPAWQSTLPAVVPQPGRQWRFALLRDL